MTFHTEDTAATEAVGRRLGEWVLSRGRTHTFVALRGDMGVGKTAFCRGVCAAFGLFRVKSPTYTVVNEYRGGTRDVFHFDLYRLSGAEELEGIGYEDYLARAGVVLCEWPERAEEALPADRVDVTLRRTDDGDGREITIRLPGEEGEIC